MNRARLPLSPVLHRAGIACAMLLLASCAPELPTATRPVSAPRAAASSEYTAMLSEVVVTLRPGADAGALAAAYGATVYEQNGDACGLLAPGDPSSLCSSIGGDSRVLTAEPNALLESPEARQESFAFDDGYGALQSYLEQPASAVLHLDDAHRAAIGSGVRVAILDTGIDPEHPAFAGRIVDGWDFVDNDPDPTDVRDGIDNDGDGQVDEAYGHGTHVAGIVALAAPGASLLVARVLDADGRGDVLAVASGIRWAVAHGARVINMSLGMLGESPAIETAIHLAEASGVMVVTSAGNWGSEEPEEFPATVDGVNAIAAADAGSRPAAFTSYGEFVALAAPGVAVRSAYPGGGYRLWSGTSMASPFVAGVAAMLLQRHPDWTPSQVGTQIRATAQPLVGLTSDQTGKLGSGMLDAAAALGVMLARGGPDPGADPGNLLR